MISDSMKQSMLNFCKFYGVEHQIKRAQSEIFELNDAIMEYERAKKSIYTQDFIKLRDHVAEEFGDVMIMLYQIILTYDINDEQIIAHMKEKIERQEKRIENGEAETI